MKKEFKNSLVQASRSLPGACKHRCRTLSLPPAPSLPLHHHVSCHDDNGLLLWTCKPDPIKYFLYKGCHGHGVLSHIRNPNLNSNLYKIWQAVYYYMLQALASAFEFFNCFIRVLNYIVYTYTYMYTKTTYRGQRTINNMWMLVFSFHRVSSRDQTQMINLDGKHLYLLNHLTRSPHPFNFFSLFQMLTWSFIHQVY